MNSQTGTSQDAHPTPITGGGRPLARFVLLTDLPPKVARAELLRAPTRVSWSLVSANNRPLARAAATFESVDACLSAIAELSRPGLDATSSVVHCSPDPGQRSYWKWTVRVGADPVAVAAFRYVRRFECEASVRRFLAVVPHASTALPTTVRVGTRLWDGTA